MRLLVIALLLAWGMLGTAFAQTIYRTKETSVRWTGETASTATIWTDGVNGRLEQDPAGPDQVVIYPIEIWKNAGQEWLLLSPRDWTYYDRRKSDKVFTEYLAAWALPSVVAPGETGGPPVKVKDLKLQMTREETAGTVAGLSCRKLTLTISYEMEQVVMNQKMKGRFKGDVVFWVADLPSDRHLAFDHGRAGFRTGVSEEIDAAIGQQLAGVAGAVLKRSASITHRSDTGQTSTDQHRFEIVELSGGAAPAGAFVVPQGYTYQEPVLIPPSRGR